MRFATAALAVFYLLPLALPGASALLHDVYHAVEAVADRLQDEHVDHGAHTHARGSEPVTHTHSSGGEAHSHAPLVDALLPASEVGDELEPAHVVVELQLLSGLHLPVGSSTLQPEPSACTVPDPGCSASRLDTSPEPAVPPPKA